jgi:hypothetical protein
LPRNLKFGFYSLVNKKGRLVEQVHVNAGSTPSEAIVIWVTDTVLPSTVTYSTAAGSTGATTGPPGERYSFLLDPSAYYPVNSTCVGSHNYTDPECFYTSGR